jgi:hypothetical protein
VFEPQEVDHGADLQGSSALISFPDSPAVLRERYLVLMYSEAHSGDCFMLGSDRRTDLVDILYD